MVSFVHSFIIKSHRAKTMCYVLGGFQVSSELYETRLPMTGPVMGVPSAVET